MRVILISYTAGPEVVVAAAGRGCYSARSSHEIYCDIDGDEERIEKQLEIIHGSCLEHASFTFSIEGLSRACTHQLVRHRLASFSQQSQRYTKVSDREVYEPGSIKADTDRSYIYYKAIDAAFVAYEELLEKGVPKEDARYVLPESVQSNITVTMNARELLHFFGLRCCRRAQEEIRELADQMMRICKCIAPLLFRDAGAQCVQLGYCPEHKCCGKAPRLIDLRNAWVREMPRRMKEEIEQEEKQC